jgi:hypothetical protein
VQGEPPPVFTGKEGRRRLFVVVWLVPQKEPRSYATGGFGDAFEKSKITKILGIILYCWNSYYKDEGGLVPIIRTEIMTKRKFRRIY